MLVVLAIIGILAALLLAALSSAKEKAIRIKCLSNVKQFDLGMLSYAQDNRDRLPSAPATTEPNHFPSLFADSLLKYGVTRDIMYDPGWPEANIDAMWYDGTDAPGGMERDIGYVSTLSRSRPYLLATYENTTTMPQPIPFVQGGPVLLPAPDPSRRVLLAGMVISGQGQFDTNPAVRATYDYGNLQYEYGLRIRSSHMVGKMPRGDNFGMLDGSAKWRKFDVMVPRSVPIWVTVWW